MNIESISSCHVCHGSNLKQTTFIIEDFFGETRERLVKMCMDCDTIHYINNGAVYYEFSVKINKSYSPKHKEIYDE
jgi:hypothetical protein